MIYDLNEFDTNPFKNKSYDVCIIGAGFAGITMALKLKSHLSILLLEGGGLDYSAESQKIYEGKNIGHEYFTLDGCRMRYFGGTSHIWAGMVLPLDDSDFRKKEFMSFSGWPIELNDIKPYLEEAKSMLNGSVKTENSAKIWNAVIKKQSYLHEINFWWSEPPANFRDKYKTEIEKRQNIHCYLNANLTDMSLLDDLSSIKEVEIQNYKKNKFIAAAKVFVLATGGIENARILLNFDKQCKSGIGNDNDLVGRFFCEHPHFDVGSLIFEDHFIEGIKSEDKSFAQKFYGPSVKFQDQEKILNFGLRVRSTKGYAPDTFKNKMKRFLCSSDFATDIYNSTRQKDINCNILERAGYDGILRIASEQIPNLSSRITLGIDKDEFGMRTTVLDWKLTKIDKQTVTKATMKFAEIFAKSDSGRVKVDEWVLSKETGFPGSPHQLGGGHHMCSTRMSTSAKDGVVDANQKIFGIDNLYIAGSSVFSTSGHANPTLTIVQMTLRLANHINYNLKME